MNLTISGHHLEVTPALREYVLTKLDRVTRHFDQVVDITVLLCVEKLSEKERRQRAEVTLHVPVLVPGLIDFPFPVRAHAGAVEEEDGVARLQLGALRHLPQEEA